MTPRPPTWLLAVLILATGCAGPRPTGADAPSVRPSAAGGQLEPRTRQVGTGDAGSQVTIRVGDLLAVAPPATTGGWRVTGYPTLLLRPLDDPAPAARHTFAAIGVGEGVVTLRQSTATYSIHVRVLRATTE